MRRLALIILLQIPAPLAAQSSRAEQASDGVMLSFTRFADHFGSWLVAAFDAIPASRYGYRPTKSQQSVGFIAQHLEDANYGLCEQILGQSADTKDAKNAKLRRRPSEKDSIADTLKARWPKDTLVARLRASLDYCDAALDHVPRLESGAQANTLLAFETDLAEHYSQIAGYMRMLGLVPPSALPRAVRVAIALPMSELPRYVGVYRLPRGVELDVTLRDGALFGKSNASAEPLRLWPEGDDVFFTKEVDAQITFTRDATARVTGLVLHRDGRDWLGRKSTE